MDHESRSCPPPPLLTGLEQVLALEHSSPGEVIIAKEYNGEEYLSEEEMDEAATGWHLSYHHGDVLPSTWDLSDSWGTINDERSALVQGMGSSCSSGHYKWRPEACGSYHAALSSDRRTVRYVGKANHPQDVGTVKGDRPLPRDRACFYFEIEVLSTCEKRPTAAMTVGLAAKGFPMHRQPGTWPHSYGYRGSDGYFFAALPPECTSSGSGGGRGTNNGSSSSSSSGNSSTRKKDCGPAFGEGDVIGCGVDFATQEVFYTKNGKYLGVAFRDIFRLPGHHQQQYCHSATRQGVVRRYVRPYLPNAFPTAMMPRQASSNTAATEPVPSSPSFSSSGIATARAPSILLSRGRFLPDSAAAPVGGRDESGERAEEGRGASRTSTTISRGLRAAIPSGVVASRASWLADAGEEEGEEDEDEDVEEEDEEGAGRRDYREQSRRRSARAGQDGGGGGGHSSRERRDASFSEGSSSSSTASAGNSTDVTIPYNTSRPERQRHQHQHQHQHQHVASSPRVLAVARSPEVAWDLFPVLSLHGVGESARVNFGQEPFCFDLQAKRVADEAERERRLAGEGMERGVEEKVEVDALIKDYLLVAGYRETLRCFDDVISSSAPAITNPAATIAVKQEKTPYGGGSSSSTMDIVGASEEQQPGPNSSCGREHEENASGELSRDRPSTFAQSLRERTVHLSCSLTFRHELRQMLLSGGGVAVITEHLIKNYPRLWRQRPIIRFELHSLAYLDLLRQGEGALREALVYAQQKLLPFTLGDTHQLETIGGLEGDVDQDSSMNMVMGGKDSNDDIPSPSKGRKMNFRRRRFLRKREVDPGGPAERRPRSPEPLRSSSFVSPRLDFAMRLRDLIGLVAYYPNLSGSPAAYLLSKGHREDVADKLNAAILEEVHENGEGEKESDKDDRDRPLLERALVGLATMHETLREVKSGGRGENFRLPALSQAHKAF
ncbi:spry-domain family protein [Nannochloropsis oceanica]